MGGALAVSGLAFVRGAVSRMRGWHETRKPKPQGEDNRRGRSKTKVPHVTPKGSADFAS